jgi:class 3 adenylate cyclase
MRWRPQRFFTKIHQLSAPQYRSFHDRLTRIETVSRLEARADHVREPAGCPGDGRLAVAREDRIERKGEIDMRSAKSFTYGAALIDGFLETSHPLQVPRGRMRSPWGRPRAERSDAILWASAARQLHVRPDGSIVQRHRLAVLATDVVAYSRLIELDDLATVCRLRRLRQQLLTPLAASYGGRIIRIAGDGALMAFECACRAVECAVAIQLTVATLDGQTPAEQPLRLRIGISFDDAIEDDGDLHGCGVNLAARLEADAEPGGILICGAVFEQIVGRVAVRCAALGERRFKNISRPVSVYSVDLKGEPDALQV